MQTFSAQKIENAQNLESFINKLKSNSQVTNILLIGDSHIQAGTLPILLKDKFQEKYGNAGRGLVFPYQVANSNGPLDYISSTNQTWQNFRLSYAQNVFENMGVAGFVLGNQKKSIIQILFSKPEDAFTKVIVFNDKKMEGDTLMTYTSSENLKLSDFVTFKKNINPYTIEPNITYPEIASKFYTTTTRLTQLNGTSIQNPVAGKTVKVEENELIYNPLFNEKLKLNSKNIIVIDSTLIKYKKPTTNFILENNPKTANLFYGFQFLNDRKNGVVFNSVGVNGATYGDFLKYPLTLPQLNELNSDLVIIMLGTNESVSSISEEDFKKNATEVINKLREKIPNLPILLVNPSANNLAAKKVAAVANWVRDISLTENTAFLDFYNLMGGSSYYTSAFKKGDARADKVHFNPSGYEKQAEKIWESLLQILN